MRDEDEQPGKEPAQDAGELQSRRAMLRLGALGTAAVLVVRPGIAQGAATSAITCQIPIPDSANAGKWIKSPEPPGLVPPWRNTPLNMQ